MKKITLFMFANLTTIALAFSQCQPVIFVDGNVHEVSGITLPVWLKTGQTLEMNGAVTSISVIEFDVNAVAKTLEFSQVLSVTALSSVPSDKVWKIESILSLPIKGTLLSTMTFTSSGTFTVPTCTNYICVEAWGAGGGGGGAFSSSSTCPSSAFAGGGGGGAYGSGCITVTPGSTINVTVGTGGSGGVGGSNGNSGGTSSVSTISAGGGSGGIGASGNGSTGAGGTGGTSSAYVNIKGGNGNSGTVGGPGGTGGAGANGGAGGSGNGCNGNGSAGTFIGGGGGGAGSANNNNAVGGAGAAGKVIISW